MRKGFLFGLMFLAVLGCAKPRDVSQELSDQLRSFNGKTQKEIFAAMGLPDGTMKLDDGTIVYSWDRNFTTNETQYNPVFNSQFQQVGGTVNSYAVQHSCNVKVSVKNGIVESFDFNGRGQGCDDILDRLIARNGPISGDKTEK